MSRKTIEDLLNDMGIEANNPISYNPNDPSLIEAAAKQQEEYHRKSKAEIARTLHQLMDLAFQKPTNWNMTKFGDVVYMSPRDPDVAAETDAYESLRSIFPYEVGLESRFSKLAILSACKTEKSELPDGYSEVPLVGVYRMGSMIAAVYPSLAQEIMKDSMMSIFDDAPRQDLLDALRQQQQSPQQMISVSGTCWSPYVSAVGSENRFANKMLSNDPIVIKF